MSEATAPAVDGQVDTSTPETEGQANENTSPETKTEAPKANWYEGASDETIGYIQNKGWDKDPLKALEAYQNLEKFQGVPSDQILKLPKDISESGALDEVYEKLGKPESPDKYDFNLPDDAVLDEGRMEMARQIAYDIGLNNKQINALVNADLEYNRQANDQLEKDLVKAQTAEIEQLKEDWGDAYEERAELGRRFIRTNLPQGIDAEATVSAIERAIGTGATLRLFGNAGSKQVSTEDTAPDTSGDRPYGYTKEQGKADKQALMLELQADPKRLDNYNKGLGPDVAKMRKLNELISK